MNSHIINAELLEEMYEGKDLGLSYAADGVVFKIWAPTAFTVSLVLYKTGGSAVAYGREQAARDSGRIVNMQRQEGGSGRPVSMKI
ncbi:early set domain-containing protein [Paenibacillus sonchi]|uniref:hypothetical protein n=1 Tax=Paenibacillus sonchi TaxID=373687 RepID=UPI001F3D3592|nr:hypothetical protein [Paenibacillus sonchi]